MYGLYGATFDKAEALWTLASLGIEKVEADFDGSGDEGWVDEVRVVSGNPTSDYDDGVVRDLADSVLEYTHAGWEINEGSFGTVTFDVAENSIHIDFNERYEEYTYSEDEL